MSNLTIVTVPNPILHAPTRRIKTFDAEIRTLTNQMRTLMHDARGVGLAAPQIGRAQKLAVLEYNPKLYEEDEDRALEIPFLVIINPTITQVGSQQEILEEGCLSIPEVTVSVARATDIHVVAQDVTGQRIKIRARGLLARILQHEIDHLNQTLIIDHGKAIKKRN
ncbi:peptide deformylase [Candidatus Berkelbacteria bacterium]|nr:peptide deformylase [Candidatus Berkelbacteria bacterium]